MEQATAAVTVVTVLPDHAAALELASWAVDARLAACAQLAETPVESVYRWQGAIERAREWRLELKTTTALAEPLTAALAARHPYEVPEILVLPVIAGHGAYLDWIAENTQPADKP